VDDARRVRLREPEARLRGDAQREVRAQRAETAEERLEVLPLEVLHHHEGQARGRVGPRVEHLHDVLRLDRPGGARLAVEAADERLVLREVAGDELHGDAAAGPGVASLEHRAHAALAERRHERVPAVERLSDHRFLPLSRAPRRGA
jgi:hypothetical protein